LPTLPKVKITNVQQAAEWRLCLGCGVCAYACPQHKVKLVDIVHDGIRPILDDHGCESCTVCLDVCPGYETIHPDFSGNAELLQELQEGWGPVLEVWEGTSADPNIHYHGSSAGLATALALYCLEKEGMHGVLHIGSDPEKALRNKTFLSRDRQALLSRTGSRYAPASPCDGLGQIEAAPAPCVFIGKPCDITGLRKAQALKPALDNKIGVAIGIFCAGTPSTLGTLDLLKSLGIDGQAAAEIRYRGKGWPGKFSVKCTGEEIPVRQISYEQSWGFLEAYRPLRCHLCPDGTSEFADISCGDPWYREIQPGEIGSSLVVVRTKRGRQILYGAMAAGYVRLERTDPGKLEASQKNLLAKRSAVGGRVATQRAFGHPPPRLRGFPLLKNLRRFPFKEAALDFGNGAKNYHTKILSAAEFIRPHERKITLSKCHRLWG
jgi:coenzyme F420 hydrogenase subunit beta